MSDRLNEILDGDFIGEALPARRDGRAKHRGASSRDRLSRGGHPQEQHGPARGVRDVHRRSPCQQPAIGRVDRGDHRPIDRICAVRRRSHRAIPRSMRSCWFRSARTPCPAALSWSAAGASSKSCSETMRRAVCMLSCDGQTTAGLAAGDRIRIRKHRPDLRLIHPAGHELLRDTEGEAALGKGALGDGVRYALAPDDSIPRGHRQPGVRLCAGDDRTHRRDGSGEIHRGRCAVAAPRSASRPRHDPRRCGAAEVSGVFETTSNSSAHAWLADRGRSTRGRTSASCGA